MVTIYMKKYILANEKKKCPLLIVDLLQTLNSNSAAMRWDTYSPNVNASGALFLQWCFVNHTVKT